MDAVTAGRETARTAALRAAAAADGGVKGDGGLVAVIGGSALSVSLPGRGRADGWNLRDVGGVKEA